YCQHLGRPTPILGREELRREATGFAACQAGRVEEAIAQLPYASATGIATRRLGDFVLDALGEEEAIRRAGADERLVAPVLSRAALTSAERALSLAGTFTAAPIQSEETERLIEAFPPTVGIGRALVEAAAALTKAATFSDHGLPHSTMNFIDRYSGRCA